MLVYKSEKDLEIHVLANIFNGLFKLSENTVLQWGGAEPIYLPGDCSCSFNRVIARDDYYASALHELSHWCIAGVERRTRVDYGYWYNPDGRSEEQQRLFEKVEIKPQALEWVLAQACGLRFKVSSDNLNGDAGDLTSFKDKIFDQVHVYLQEKLPKRASLLIHSIAEDNGRQCYLAPRFFIREAI